MPGVTTNMTAPGQDQDHMGRVARSAYLMVKGSVAEDLVTREELLEALQCAGECYCYLQSPVYCDLMSSLLQASTRHSEPLLDIGPRPPPV